MPSLKLRQLKEEKNKMQFITHVAEPGQRLNPSQKDCPSPAERGRGEAKSSQQEKNDPAFALSYGG